MVLAGSVVQTTLEKVRERFKDFRAQDDQSEMWFRKIQHATVFLNSLKEGRGELW